MAGRLERLPVEVDERHEPLGLTADDRERQRQAEGAGADHRLRRSADGDPHRQRILDRAAATRRVVERRAVATRPGHMRRLADLQQQLELLGEQLVVVVEVVAEQREGLDERTPPGHDLGATARDQVELGELLEDADRVVRAEHRDRAREPDPLGPCRDRGQGDGGRGDEEVGAVMLADREHVEPELVGELGLLEQVAHPLLGADARGEVGEGGKSKFHDGNQDSR